MSQSQNDTEPGSPVSKKNSKQKNFHVIELDWAHQFVDSLARQMPTDPSKKEADVKIVVTSRRIKNQENSPADILFRTHHYEFSMEPNESFFSLCGGRNHRYLVELRLVKNMVHLKRKSSDDNSLSQSSQMSYSQESQMSNSQNDPQTPTSGPSISIFSSGTDTTDPESPPMKRQRVVPKIVPKSVKHYMEQQQQKSQQVMAAPSSPNKNNNNNSSSPSPPSTPPLVSDLNSNNSSQNTDKSSLSGAKLEFEDLLHSENDKYFVLHTTDNDEFKEFVENDVPVVTYSFTEDIVTGKWNLNLIWPTEKRPLSWRGKFCFHLSIFRRDGFHTYNHIMSKISSQFCIFSKPDVYLKKVRKSNTKSASGCPSPIKGTSSRQSGSVATKRTRNSQPISPMTSSDASTEQQSSDSSVRATAIMPPMALNFPLLHPANLGLPNFHLANLTGNAPFLSINSPPSGNLSSSQETPMTPAGNVTSPLSNDSDSQTKSENININ